jgi:hypothetical protein
MKARESVLHEVKKINFNSNQQKSIKSFIKRITSFKRISQKNKIDIKIFNEVDCCNGRNINQKGNRIAKLLRFFKIFALKTKIFNLISGLSGKLLFSLGFFNINKF